MPRKKTSNKQRTGFPDLANKAIKLASDSQLLEATHEDELKAVQADIALLEAHYPGMDDEAKARADKQLSMLKSRDWWKHRRFDRQHKPANELR